MRAENLLVNYSKKELAYIIWLLNLRYTDIYCNTCNSYVWD